MAVIATDNFNRADGGLGANWTTQTGGYDNPAIVSQVVQAGVVGGNGSLAQYSGASFPNDQYSQLAVVSAFNSNYLILPCVRMASAANTFYAAQIKGPLGGTAVAQLKKVVAGATTVLVANTTFTLSANDVFRLEVIGTTLTLYQNNGTFLTTTDSSIASGTPGLGIAVASGSTTLSSLDLWEGGSLGSDAILYVRRTVIVDETPIFIP